MYGASGRDVVVGGVGSWAAGWPLRLALLLLLSGSGLLACSDELAAPVAAIDAPPTARIGEQVTVDGSASTHSGGGALAYAWRFADVPAQSRVELNDTSLVAPSFMPDQPGDYVVELVVSSGVRDSVPARATIAVADASPEGQVSATATPDAGLSPLAVTLSCAASAGDPPLSYYWDFGDGQSSTQAEPSHVYTGSGTFTARCTVTDANGQTDSATTTIAVEGDETPVVAINADRLSGFAPLTVAFESQVTAGNGPLTYTWSFGDGTALSGELGSAEAPADLAAPTHVYASAGSFLARLTVEDGDGDGASAELTLTVGVDSLPAVVAAAAPDFGTSPLTVQLDAAASGGDAPLEFAWDFDVADGDDAVDSTAQAPRHTYASAVDTAMTARVTVTDADGDVATSDVSIAIEADVVPDGTVTASAELVTGYTPLMTRLQCAGEGNAPLAYQWDFGDGGTSALQNPVHVYEIGGVYDATCTLTDRDGQSASASVTIDIVQDVPPTLALVAAPLSGLAPLEVSLLANADGGNAPLALAWDFGDGSDELKGDPATVGATSYTFATPGTYQVRLRVTDQDGDLASETIQIAVGTDAAPAIAIDAAPRAGIAPLEVAFSANLGGGNAPLAVAWDFDFHDGDSDVQSTALTPRHTYATAGTYRARAVVTDADGDSHAAEVTIAVEADEAVAVAATASPTAGLAPLAVTFGCSSPTGNEPLRYAWDFGDGGSSALPEPSHTYAAGDYEARCTVTDANGDAATGTVDVSVEGDTAPAVTLDAAPLAGIADLTVDFAAAVTGGNPPLSYTWRFGDGNSATDTAVPPHVYAAGAYRATLTVVDGDGDTGSDSVLIAVEADSPAALTVSAAPRSGTAPLAVSFEAEALAGNGPFTWAWDFDVAAGPSVDATSPNPNHEYLTPGSFLARATLTDADGDTASADITIEVAVPSSPAGQVAVTPPTASGTAPLQVDFTCSAGAGNPPLAYAWTFGDGGTAAAANPVHVYERAGSFMATCTVTDADGETGSAAATISVAADTSPTVLLSAAPLAGIAPLEVTFDSAVLGGNPPLLYRWDFGQGPPLEGELGSPGAPPDLEAPVRTYPTGTWVARLTVTDADGDVGSDTVTITAAADQPATVLAGATPSFGAPALAVQLTAQAGGDAPFTFSWDFTDDGVSDSAAQNPTHLYADAGLFTARVRVTDADGDEAEDTVAIEVNAPPVVDAGADQCLIPGQMAALGATASDPEGMPLSYSWTFLARPAGSFTELNNAGLRNPSFQVDRRGAYQLRVTVSDGNLQVTDEVWVYAEPEIEVLDPDPRVGRAGQPIDPAIAVRLVNHCPGPVPIVGESVFWTGTNAVPASSERQTGPDGVATYQDALAGRFGDSAGPGTVSVATAAGNATFELFVETCADAVQNGDESDVDCGGLDCGATCAFGEACQSDADCAGVALCDLSSAQPACVPDLGLPSGFVARVLTQGGFLDRPRGLAFDPAGNRLYAINEVGGAIAIDANGDQTPFSTLDDVGTSADVAFQPYDGGGGALWLTSTGVGGVVGYSVPDAQVLPSAVGGLLIPHGIDLVAGASDSQDLLAVAQFGGVEVFTNLLGVPASVATGFDFGPLAGSQFRGVALEAPANPLDVDYRFWATVASGAGQYSLVVGDSAGDLAVLETWSGSTIELELSPVGIFAPERLSGEIWLERACTEPPCGRVTFAEGLGDPRGLALADDLSTLWVSDAETDTVYAISGPFSGFCGDGLCQAGEVCGGCSSDCGVCDARVAAHFTFDEAAAQIADTRGVLPGTVTGHTFMSLDGVEGRALGALVDFGNRDEKYVRIADGPELDLVPPFTLSLWLRPRQFDQGGVVLTKAGAYRIGTSNAFPYVVIEDGQFGCGAVATFPLELAAWNHLAVSHDGQTLQMVINGSVAGEISCALPPVASDADLFVFDDPNDAFSRWNGAVDELQLWSVALDAESVCLESRICPACADQPDEGSCNAAGCFWDGATCQYGRCFTDGDCAGVTDGACWSGVCQGATCEDGILNQDEVDVDCGGICGPCPDGFACFDDVDCVNASCLGGVCDAQCEAPGWSPPNRVVQDFYILDSADSIAAGRPGEWFLFGVYAEDDQDPAVLRSNDDGLTWSEPILTPPWAPFDTTSENAVAGAADDQGHLLIAYVTRYNFGGKGTDEDVVTQYSDDGGDTWSAPRTIHPGAMSDGGFGERVLAVAEAGGTWIVMYDQIVSGVLDPIVVRSDDGGETWDAPILLGDATGNLSVRAALAGDGQGNWVAAWSNPGGSAWVSRSQNDGVSWSARASAGGMTVTDLEVDDAGNWIMAGYVGSEFDVQSRTSTDAGLNWGTPVFMNADATTDGSLDYDFTPRVAYGGSGVWVGLWDARVAGSPGEWVEWARSEDAGASWTTDQRLYVQGPTVHSDQQPVLGADGQGNFMAAFRHILTDNTLWAGTSALCGFDFGD